MNSTTPAALDLKHLSVEFDTYGGTVKAVRDVSLTLRKGKTLAIVGESGCGKSVLMQSIMGLIPMPPGRITEGSALLHGEELLGLSQAQLNAYRGSRIGMIFQDPMSSLNPTMRVGEQIAETLLVHRNMDTKSARQEAIKILKQVHIPEAETRAKQYPFEFSGGMLQRVMIAISIACNPSVLIADEPTTALDVTIQAQILQLLKDLQAEHGLSIVLITHDLGVVATMAHDVAVMYAGKIVETGSVDDIFYRSSHPYTIGLKGAIPKNSRNDSKLITIPGSPPDLFNPPQGCSFYARCPHAMQVCEQAEVPSYATGEHRSQCWLHHPDSPVSTEFTKLNNLAEEVQS